MAENWKKLLPNHWNAITIIIVSLVVVLTIGCLILQRVYHNRIYPGVVVGEFSLTGQNQEEAQFYIQEQVTMFDQGMVFYYQDKELIVKSAVQAFDIDLSYTLFDVDAYQTAQSAYEIGRQFNFLIRWKDRLIGLLFHKQIPLTISLNETKLKELLKEHFGQYTIPVQNAQLVKDEHGNFSVQAEESGLSLDYDQAIKDLAHNLQTLTLEPIRLVDKQVEPEILKQDSLNIDNQAKQILALSPIILKHEDESWEIKEDTISEWLALELGGARSDERVAVVLNYEKIVEYLEVEIAEEINQPAVDARFKMDGDKVSVFQGGHDGWEVDLVASAEKINNSLAEKINEIDLVIIETRANSKLAEISDLGIKEIIGTGHSDFSGSPSNRRHNIQTGASSLGGILIKPEEEFSLMTVLGEIDAESGYLPELVIKGNETIAEYGGGLCQIGTTIFRTALETGLPITMRRNHSYRVSYYEPAGTDATIYDPWPDMKFLNDTGNHILIQYRIEGNDLYFDFWGTNDRRKIEISKPVIYNITEPEPTRLVETLDLPVGKKKCTEHAHNGADAYFDYVVTYLDGEVIDERFSSHYVPWQEVCLIGVEKLSTEEDTGLGVYEKLRQGEDNEVE